MNLKGTMLSEINQTEKDKYHMISLTCEMQKGNTNRKTNNMNKTNHIKTNKQIQQSRGYQREREVGDKMDREDQLYGDERKPKLWQ